MSGFKKVIKYFAIVLAIFFATCIFECMFMGVLFLGNWIEQRDDKSSKENLVELEINGNDYSELDIELGSSSIEIKEADSFKVETNNKYISVSEGNKSLKIDESKHFLTDTDYIVVIYVPYNYEFDEVSIESGAGKVEVEKLSTRDINLDLGAGKVIFDNLIVTDDAEIDGGAGSIEISDGTINNLDLNLGIGRFAMTAKLTGNNEVKAGFGECKINLIGSMNDYTVNVNKGIGDAIVGEYIVDNNTSHGNGPINVYIDGGAGGIIVKYSL